MIDNILLNLSNSKLFSGCIMLLTNIGGKYLAQEMPSNIEKLFQNNFLLRNLVLFSVFFMATRDIKISILLSFLFFIIIKYFMNEKSTFCLLKNTEHKKITEKEYIKAKEIVDQFSKESKYA